MKGLSLFSRLLILSVSVVLVCVAVLSGLGYTNLRDNMIRKHMETLNVHAKEISYLGSRISLDNLSMTSKQNRIAEELLITKTNLLYEQYNAVTVLVEYSRQYRFYPAIDENVQTNIIPSPEAFAKYDELAFQGKGDIGVKKNAFTSVFSVMVPWVRVNEQTQQSTVVGYVLILSTAQAVRNMYRDLIWQTALAAMAMFLLASAIVFFVAQQMTRPLTAMAKTAGEMARGNFEARAPEGGGKEIEELSRAFNQMGAQLSTLEQSRRDFVANVSHELRSPITSIKGFAQGMLDGTIPQEMHGQYLQVVVDETQRLAKLINNLLNLSRMENEDTSLAYSHFDLNEMIRRVLISRMAQIDDKGLDIQVRFENDSCFVHADADQIQQVVINLLDNAVKYTPSGGTITLLTKTEGSQVSARIKDNGMGIPAEDAPFIFDRFYKVDKAHTVGKGTGLGLAICKRIMERHGQQIRLVSGEGGAEFEITLEKGADPGGNHGNTGAGEN